MIILGIKIAIVVAVYFLSLLFFAQLQRTIDKYKKDTSNTCSTHEWEYRDVSFDQFKSGYYVCKHCKRLAGTDYYEETP